MQASGIIGLVGLAIGVGPLVPRTPLPTAVYLATLIGACACIMLLAMLDIWATRQHLRRLHDDQLAEEIKQAMKQRCADKSFKGDS
jgi:hypothetical protein